MCQLTDTELNKHVMKMTTAFCREKSEQSTPKIEYIKKAAVCLGRQPGSKEWVLSTDAHINNEDGEFLPPERREYVWLGDMVGNRILKNIALPSDAASISTDADPNDVFDETLIALKEAVNNNFVPAFTILGSAAMGMHYEAIHTVYGMCPSPVAVGHKHTGKSTAARTALALLGTPHFFVRDFTSTAPSVLNSRKTLPTVFDDPDEIHFVKSLIDDTFNKGGRCTLKIRQSLGHWV